MNKSAKRSCKTLFPASLLVIILILTPHLGFARTNDLNPFDPLSVLQNTSELVSQIVNRFSINFPLSLVQSSDIKSNNEAAADVEPAKNNTKSKVTLRTVAALFCLVLIIMIAAVRVVLARKIDTDDY